MSERLYFRPLEYSMIAEQSDLVLYYCGRQVCEPLHYWSGVRDHYLMHIVLRGKGVLRIPRQDLYAHRQQRFHGVSQLPLLLSGG